MIVLIHSDMELWDFMIEGLKSRNDLYNIPLNRYCSIVNRLFRKYLGWRHLPPCFVLGRNLIKILKRLNSKDKIVVSYLQPCLFYAIRDVVGHDVPISFWMWDPIKDDPKLIKNISLLKKMGIKCSTFDFNDAKALGLNYLSTFYNMSIAKHLVDKPEIMYDFYFLGVPKDRGDLILKIKESLSSYNNLFVVPLQPSQYITYSQNINYIRSSRCLVDITQMQQSDITLRPLEALAYKKKLITNNVNIRQYPFYSPNNIFIWGIDPLEAIGDFLDMPYDDCVKDEIIDKYDVNYWLDRI